MFFNQNALAVEDTSNIGVENANDADYLLNFNKFNNHNDSIVFTYFVSNFPGPVFCACTYGISIYQDYMTGGPAVVFTNTNVHISMYKNDGTAASSSPSIGATVTSMKITGSNNVNYSIPMKNNPNSCLYDMMTIAVHSCKVNNNSE